MGKEEQYMSDTKLNGKPLRLVKIDNFNKYLSDDAKKVYDNFLDHKENEICSKYIQFVFNATDISNNEHCLKMAAAINKLCGYFKGFFKETSIMDTYNGEIIIMAFPLLKDEYIGIPIEELNGVFFY